MSNKEYAFWVHGVNTIVERPEHTQVIRHTGLGTIIEQDEDPPGRNNWFHLPIPTPTLLEGESAFVGKFTLKVWMNENVRLTDVHVRVGDYKIADETPNLVGQDQDAKVNFNISHGEWFQMKGGLSLCARFEFLSGSPRGRIVTRGAGARFKKD
jgi:hypothetical protein